MVEEDFTNYLHLNPEKTEYIAYIDNYEWLHVPLAYWNEIVGKAIHPDIAHLPSEWKSYVGNGQVYVNEKDQ